jgi:hypothetical protein
VESDPARTGAREQQGESPGDVHADLLPHGEGSSIKALRSLLVVREEGKLATGESSQAPTEQVPTPPARVPLIPPSSSRPAADRARAR